VGELVFRAVDRKTWPDFAALFESKGGPGYCWCMAWRPLATKLRNDVPARRAAMKALVDAGVPVGILAYHDGDPIGWCSIAPRETHRPLGGIDGGGEAIWSLACFFLKRDWRGSGHAAALLDAAVAYARQAGADLVEAYPVDPDSPSYRFMGFVDLFRRAGFTGVGRAGTRRHVMRLALNQGD
jgi:GNAT superfamily N-acetyltransferase